MSSSKYAYLIKKAECHYFIHFYVCVNENKTVGLIIILSRVCRRTGKNGQERKCPIFIMQPIQIDGWYYKEQSGQ